MVTAVGQSAAGTAAGGVHGFALPLTSFVGRAAAVSAVAGLLDQYRLVTLTGPGGAGKTRLAGQVAEQVAGQFADEAWLAELAPLRDPAQIPGDRRHPKADLRYLCASVLADHDCCSSGRSGEPGGSGASHAASQKGWRALRVHRHSAARVSVTQPPAVCIRRSPRRRKGPRSTARIVAGTSGCSPGIPGAW
jgi:hypothetical protein